MDTRIWRLQTSATGASNRRAKVESSLPADGCLQGPPVRIFQLAQVTLDVFASLGRSRLHLRVNLLRHRLAEEVAEAATARVKLALARRDEVVQLLLKLLDLRVGLPFLISLRAQHF
jgi:hypothetical protein